MLLRSYLCNTRALHTHTRPRPRQTHVRCQYADEHDPNLPPICVNCVYFQADTFYNLEKSNNELGKCTYRGRVNIITGEIIYPFAVVMRVNGKNQCGFKGVYYEPKEEQKEQQENECSSDEGGDGAV